MLLLWVFHLVQGNTKLVFNAQSVSMWNQSVPTALSKHSHKIGHWSKITRIFPKNNFLVFICIRYFKHCTIWIWNNFLKKVPYNRNISSFAGLDRRKDFKKSQDRRKFCASLTVNFENSFHQTSRLNTLFGSPVYLLLDHEAVVSIWSTCLL